MRYLLALAAVCSLPLLLAQPSEPLLLLTPSTTSLNTTSGKVELLTFLLQNAGGETAVNVTLNLAAGGCVQLLSERGVWEAHVAVSVGDVAPGSIKRVVVPLRCRDSSGTVVAIAYGDNADPAYAVVRVSAREEVGLQLPVLLSSTAVAGLVAAYAVRRFRRERSGGRRGARRGRPTRRGARSRALKR